MTISHPSDPANEGDSPSEARDLALTEFTVLKAEAQARISAQVTLVGFALTAAAGISAVALSSGGTAKHAQIPNRLLLLLIVPLVVNGLGMSFLQHSIVRSRIGAYCRDVLWPHIGAPAGLEGFDVYLAHTRKSRRRFSVMVIVVANLAIFTTSDTLALILVHGQAINGTAFTESVWIFDVVFSGMLIVFGIVSLAEFAQPRQHFLIPGLRGSGSSVH